MRAALDRPNRYVRNLAGFEELHARHGLATFGRMAGLCRRLNAMDELRTETAAAWLRRVGRPAASFDGLASHGPEWFAAYDARDLRQAAIVRQIIGLAGHADVCGICGDEPAGDFRLASNEDPADGGLSLRLCADFEPLGPVPT